MTARAREIHHIALTVSDLAASEKFYGEVLGLQRTLDMPIRDPVVLDAMRRRAGAFGRSVCFQGPTQLGQIELIEWRDHGVAPSGPKREAVLENYGPITVVILADPDGVLVELVALSTREQIRAFRANRNGTLI